ncbi:hypothetical protein B9Z19DRAFT_1163383 [Tuber borchii]|uniref:Uncharacterized protein n=1 Tax=Tuber borchii TaxID=42251 RepID=A0A2T6ZD22_TUBBO|nr:hypothetical protein B9Z19DRAFT_1163383 [Tuber borchii]
MSRKGKEWSWYHRGGNKNVRYFEVWCNYCLLHAKAVIIRENPGLALMPGDDHGEKELLELAKKRVTSFAGRKETMLNHLIDLQKCPHAPPEIRHQANLEKFEWKQRLHAGSSRDHSMSPSRLQTQSPYTDYSPPPPHPLPPPPPQPQHHIHPPHPLGLGIDDDLDAPFTRDDEEIFHLQVARATASAGLPDRWIEDPEVIELFRLLRGDVSIPSSGHIRRLRDLLGWG